jgi:hypothetical protein
MLVIVHGPDILFSVLAKREAELTGCARVHGLSKAPISTEGVSRMSAKDVDCSARMRYGLRYLSSRVVRRTRHSASSSATYRSRNRTRSAPESDGGVPPGRRAVRKRLESHPMPGPNVGCRQPERRCRQARSQAPSKPAPTNRPGRIGANWRSPASVTARVNKTVAAVPITIVVRLRGLVPRNGSNRLFAHENGIRRDKSGRQFDAGLGFVIRLSSARNNPPFSGPFIWRYSWCNAPSTDVFAIRKPVGNLCLWPPAAARGACP